MDTRLRTPSASALALGTRTCTSIASTLTNRLLGPSYLFHCLLILLQAAATLPALQVRQASCLGVDILNLFVALSVEAGKFLTSRRSQRFLEVRVDTSPSGSRLIRDTVALIKSLGTITRLVLCVELGEGIGEAVGDTMLVVEGNGTLDGGVADHVAMGEVLGNDARARFIFL